MNTQGKMNYLRSCLIQVRITFGALTFRRVCHDGLYAAKQSATHINACHTDCQTAIFIEIAKSHAFQGTTASCVTRKIL